MRGAKECFGLARRAFTCTVGEAECGSCKSESVSEGFEHSEDARKGPKG